jgi:Uncharacterized conserved protein (COG2071)
MLSFLQQHPFPVEAYFETSLVVTFAYPKAQVAHLIPPCLTLDTFHDEWAFVAVAMVQTKSLRPKGFPAFLGNDFFLCGYRVFVRYTTRAGKRLRGLYILKSQTDRKKMEVLGNLFTHYNYETVPIRLLRDQHHLTVTAGASHVAVQLPVADEILALPATSPFADWKEARRFAGPLPFTFAYAPDSQQVTIVEGVRQHWTPQSVAVLDYALPLLRTFGLPEGRLANAFYVHDIPYSWKKGRTEQWHS